MTVDEEEVIQLVQQQPRLDSTPSEDSDYDERQEFFASSSQAEGIPLRHRLRSPPPNPIVANVVSLDDDSKATTLSFRVLLLGSFLGCTGAAVGQIFFFKSNGIGFNIFLIILVSYPTSGASGSSYAGDIVAVQDLYYHRDIGHVGGLLLVLSTQLIGFGLAGMTYSLLVRPTNMVWPSSLVVMTMYNTLHSKSSGMSSFVPPAEESILMAKKFKFFLIVFGLITIYQFIPTVFAPTLSSIAVLCLINNRSTFMRVLGSALLMGTRIIRMTGIIFVELRLGSDHVGVITNTVLLVVQLFCGDCFTRMATDNKYEKYDVAAVVKPDLTLDLEKYNQMGPIQLTPYFALYYGIGFAVLTSAITTVILFHSDDIRKAMAARTKASTDAHVEMMEKSYAKVPASWYITIGTSMTLAAIYVVVAYPLQALCFTIPLGIMFTMGSWLTFVWLGEFRYGYMTMHQCLDLAADLKLGIYAKIPPKDMFISQILGTAIGGVVNYIFIRLVIADKREYLDGSIADPTGQWTGRKPELFYSGSVVCKYKYLYLGIPLGAVLPFIPWYLSKRYPRWSWEYFSVPR
ncbi:hypothetical protein VP01_387g8 [Puccinia sorghi]|uniref:OPT family small oligopeptide transporter protein n=1 Tax=Puccinia sorghi TaxID=27349 RepID=A0A0L6USX1_9BASI|nr:hypothetical protein VP01_387g8 [Puccinia sorghi]